jgi:hypothetical protein
MHAYTTLMGSLRARAYVQQYEGNPHFIYQIIRRNKAFKELDKLVDCEAAAESVEVSLHAHGAFQVCMAVHFNVPKS